MSQKASLRPFTVRKLTITAMMSALSFILMKFLCFKLPFMPFFITMDFSELPALITAFALGPIWGVLVCLIKNVLSLFSTNTMAVGELSNFILGAAFVFTAGMLYKHMGGRKGALIGSLCGAVFMAVISVVSNYYVVYPIYAAYMMPMDSIMNAYQAINPNVETLWDALLWFNLPFTFCKGMASVVITFLNYKKISPLLKGRKKDSQ